MHWLGRWWQRFAAPRQIPRQALAEGFRRALGRAPRTIPEPMWAALLAHCPFLGDLSPEERTRLRDLTGQFLADKEFSGAHGLEVTDEMALAIAAQACLPVLHLGLHWYDDFRGIVVHPAAMLARREIQDDIGLVHHYTEELSGEAMDGGPVALSWPDVSQASSETGYNVVIHEFVHKLDMRDGQADGCPLLPGRDLRRRWAQQMQSAYDDFCDALERADRFGGPAPWLDAYAATAPAEFFAVACEAYFVNRPRFAQEHAALLPLFDAFFQGASER